MPFAESSLSVLYIGQSVTEGTQPTANETVKPTGHTLSYQADSFTSDDIDSSRKGRDSTRTNTRGEGDISFHWRTGNVTNMLIESACGNAFGSALSLSGETVSFSAVAFGVQQITAITTTIDMTTGDFVTIGGADDAVNAGDFRIQSVDSASQITVVNPQGTAAPSDSSVSFDHNGATSLGSTKLFIWAEKLFFDGTNYTYGELYGDGLVSRFTLSFAASRPSQVTATILSDAPLLSTNDGGGGITTALTGSIAAVTTNRLINSMDDVVDLHINDSGSAVLELEDLCDEWSMTIDNAPRQDFAIGGAGAVGTTFTTPTITGTLSTYINDADPPTAEIVKWLNSNPDTLSMGIYFTTTMAGHGYGIHFPTLRITAAPSPVSDGSSATKITASWSATDARFTRGLTA